MFPALFFLSTAAGSQPSPGYFLVILPTLVLYAVGIAITLRLSLLLPARAA
jgi:hypothetical protein